LAAKRNKKTYQEFNSACLGSYVPINQIINSNRQPMIKKNNLNTTNKIVSVAMLFIFVGIFMTEDVKSQDKPAMNRWNVDLSLTNHMAEESSISPLTGQMDALEAGLFNLGVSGGLRFYVSPVFSLQLDLGYLSLNGDYGDVNDTSFESSIINASGRVNVQLTHLFKLKKENWTQTLHAGYGVSVADVTGGFAPDSYNVNHYFFGLGAKRKLSDRLDFYGEYSYVFNRLSALDALEIGNDRFGKLSFGVSFKLGKTGTNRVHGEWYPYLDAMAVAPVLPPQAPAPAPPPPPPAPPTTPPPPPPAPPVVEEPPVREVIEVPPPPPAPPVIEPVVPALEGVYVQMFAGLSLERTRNAHRMTVEHFNALGVRVPSVVIHKSQNTDLYFVRVGVYENTRTALALIEDARKLFSDAYVNNVPAEHIAEELQNR
jgi:hypothetical protein